MKHVAWNGEQIKDCPDCGRWLPRNEWGMLFCEFCNMTVHPKDDFGTTDTMRLNYMMVRNNGWLACWAKRRTER